MKELQALIGQDTYKDNRTFWEGEMSNAIRELQNEFDRRLDHQNKKMQSYYQMKVSDVRDYFVVVCTDIKTTLSSCVSLIVRVNLERIPNMYLPLYS